MDAKYINKNYLEETIKDYDATIVDPIRNVVGNIYYNTANKYKDLLNIINASISGGIGLNLQLNYINSTSPVNYQNVEHVAFTTGQIGNLWCATPGKAGTQYYDWNTSTNTLTFSSLTGIVTFNTDMHATFKDCANLNQNILIPNSVTNISNTFVNCLSLNQNIQIPNGVTDMSYAFVGCTNLNQNILIPNSVTNISSLFGVQLLKSAGSNGATNLNQNIQIPNGVTDMHATFAGCTSLDQNILIPNSVTNMSGTFSNCQSLNQNILIPNSVGSCVMAFSYCLSLNQNIFIYSENISAIADAFKSCTLLSDKYIHIRSSIPMATSNYIYNSLVNNSTGINWTGRVVNDLEEPTQWPPV